MTIRFPNKMNAFATAAAVVLLTGCGNSQWKTHYENGEKALAGNAPNRLAVAENELMTAVEIAWKAKVPEKEFVHVYTKLGEVMLEEKKYAESQKYFLRTLQYANARKMGVDENIALLRKLVTAYEKTRDYDQASQTQDVLVHLIEFEKSPLAPEYKGEVHKNNALKIKLAQFNQPVATPQQISENPKPDTSAIESNKQAQLLQGWH